MPKDVILPEDLDKVDKEAKQDALLRTREELKQLTPKRRRLIEILAKNPSMTFIQAAKDAGYQIGKNARAATIKREIAGKLSITLREMGIFESDLARVATEALNATKVQILRIPKRGDDGKVIDERLEVIESPDHTNRLAAFKLLCHLGDYFPAKKIDISKTGGDRPFKDVSLDLLKKRADELSKVTEEAEFEEVVTKPEQDDEGRVGTVVHQSGDLEEKSLDVSD